MITVDYDSRGVNIEDENGRYLNFSLYDGVLEVDVDNDEANAPIIVFKAEDTPEILLTLQTWIERLNAAEEPS